MGVELVDDNGKTLTIIAQDDAPTSSDEREWAFFIVDSAMVKRILMVLTAAYPGYDWWAEARHFHGYVQVALPTFSVWGPIIKLIDLKGDPRLKLVVDAAGELLERYNLPRSAADMAAVDAAIVKHMPALTHRLRPPD